MNFGAESFAPDVSRHISRWQIRVERGLLTQSRWHASERVGATHHHRCVHVALRHHNVPPARAVRSSFQSHALTGLHD